MSKQKIAVIGGGVGAITAVFAITRDADWAEKYDITLYQMGWRLGGKGASGRKMDQGARIEEHGLHVWAGFYDNAFRNMRACYEDLVSLGLRKANAPLGTIDAAFKPLTHLFLAEHLEGSDAPWRPWLIDLPGNKLVPGTAEKVPTPFEMFLQVLAILREFLEKGELSGAAKAHMGDEAWGRLTHTHGALHGHSLTMPGEPVRHRNRHSGILADLIADAQKVVHDLETPENIDHDATRRVLYLMDVSLAYAMGMVSSDAFCSGYDVLDQWEFTEWLRLNGASELALNSVLLRGCYDFVFGFPMGRTVHGNAGAGTSIRAMSRLVLTYRGAIFFKMQAGMGDTIFAPYYQVLKKIGVKFKYFNAARSLRLSEDGTAIDRIDMVRQAKPKGEYDPLVDVKDLPCWPSEPLWDQLEDGEKLKASGIDFESEQSPPEGERYTLIRGEDFDTVILGASLGSLPYLTAELRAQSSRWDRMLSSVKTVGTHAAQFWLTKTADELGWRQEVEAHNNASAIPPSPLRTMITGFAEPLDTWADMSHLIPREDWPEDGPASIAYFCAPAPDGETLDQFKADVANWTNEDLPKFWPNATDGDGFDPANYYAPGKSGDAAFDAQYFRVNMFGSERYVLSVRDSVFHRLAPDESGFENLVIAGDWTRCGINAGCVEAATMSGIAAAAAVTGHSQPNIGAEDLPDFETVRDKAMYQTNSISAAAWPIAGFFARGEMTGWFMFYNMPREEVEPLLPKGVHLARAPGIPSHLHPVGISLCRYQKVRGSFVPDFMAMSPYGEATFAIPYTHSDDAGRARLLYPRKLYVNSSSAILAGKIFYAMNKSNADIDVTDSTFTASLPGYENFIHGRFEQQDVISPLSDHPEHGRISDLLDQSFVTERSSGRQLFNAFNLQLDRAYVAPVSGHVTVNDPNDGGFPSADIHFSPLGHDATPGLPGAFRIWCSWSMTNPLDSKRIRHAAEARSWLQRTY